MRKVSALICMAASLVHAYHNPVFTALLKSDDDPVMPILIPNLIQNLIPASLPLRRIAMDCDGL